MDSVFFMDHLQRLLLENAVAKPTEGAERRRSSARWPWVLGLSLSSPLQTGEALEFLEVGLNMAPVPRVFPTIIDDQNHWHRFIKPKGKVPPVNAKPEGCRTGTNAKPIRCLELHQHLTRLDFSSGSERKQFQVYPIVGP